MTVGGTGFYNVTGVTVGGEPATSFTVVSPTSIQLVTPAGDPGAVYIEVQTDVNGYDLTSPTSSASQFTYTAGSSAPAAHGLSPADLAAVFRRVGEDPALLA